MDFKITYEANASVKDLQVLTTGIEKFAKQQKGMKPIENFAFFLRDDANQIKGGCNGIFYYGCMYIDQLWIHEGVRKKGLGTHLIKLVEELGKKKGCTFSTVNTMDWEALTFYIKLGYDVIFQMSGYEENSTYYLLRKDFIGLIP